MAFLRRILRAESPAEGRAPWRNVPRGWFILLAVVSSWALVGLLVWLATILLSR